jgi:hypothetical protein
VAALAGVGVSGMARADTAPAKAAFYEFTITNLVIHGIQGKIDASPQSCAEVFGKVAVHAGGQTATYFEVGSGAPMDVCEGHGPVGSPELATSIPRTGSNYNLVQELPVDGAFTLSCKLSDQDTGSSQRLCDRNTGVSVKGVTESGKTGVESYNGQFASTVITVSYRLRELGVGINPATTKPGQKVTVRVRALCLSKDDKGRWRHTQAAVVSLAFVGGVAKYVGITFTSGSEAKAAYTYTATIADVPPDIYAVEVSCPDTAISGSITVQGP